MIALPDLARVVAEAEPSDLPALAGRLREAEVVLEQRLRNGTPTSAMNTAPDTNLDVQEAARRLGVSKCWVYRHAGELPFAVRVGRRITFSGKGLEQWRQRRMGLD